MGGDYPSRNFLSADSILQMPSIKIASYPGRGNQNNPYVDLFYDALAPHGIELVDELIVDADWLGAQRDRFDGIHLHWPEVSWRNPGTIGKGGIRGALAAKIPGVWRLLELWDRLVKQPGFGITLQSIGKIFGLIKFYRFLQLARKSGLFILWTFHNSESHEGNDYFDRIGYSLLSRYVDLVIFHSKISKELYESRFKIKRLSVIMPHGNYGGVYPQARSKATILGELGLRSDVPIVSCLGMLRDYKGLDVACDAVAAMNGEVQLLCAGWPHPSFALTEFRAKIEGLSNITLIPRFLSNQEFSDYTALSEIVLLPYRKVTGSGALLAALTLGRSIIASDLPYFREIIGDEPTAGRLVPAENAEALAEAIRDFLKVSFKDRCDSARIVAQRYSWNNVIPPVVHEIRNLVREKK